MLQTGLAVFFGFCAALFLVLLISPSIARRVSALTWRQATRVLPQSSEEIAAARDHLRAQNALDMRQLEMKMENVAEKERHLRIGKQAFEDKIIALEGDGSRLRGAIDVLEATKTRLNDELGTALHNNAMLTTENADRDVRLATLSSEFTQLRNDHTRQVAAFGLMQEAHRQIEQRLDVSRQEASGLRSKVATAESELRIARSEAKRNEGDLKLANRKISGLEAKLERSIRLMAEAEERLERREAELKRMRETAKPSAATIAAVKSTPVKADILRPDVLKPTVMAAPVILPKTPPVNVQTETIKTNIATLRPALRVAANADSAEQARIKAAMQVLAGLVTEEAAASNPEIAAKLAKLQPGSSALADALLKHNKVAAE